MFVVVCFSSNCCRWWLMMLLWMMKNCISMLWWVCVMVLNIVLKVVCLLMSRCSVWLCWNGWLVSVVSVFSCM